MIKQVVLAFLLGFSLMWGAQSYAHADPLAYHLGSLLASEKPCGFTFDQQAIQQFIKNNVKADDMSFNSDVALAARVDGRAIAQMSPSSLTVQCTQAQQIAKQLGFMH